VAQLDVASEDMCEIDLDNGMRGSQSINDAIVYYANFLNSE
jgi:hypothetical protein